MEYEYKCLPNYLRFNEYFYQMNTVTTSEYVGEGIKTISRLPHLPAKQYPF
jgi:hypothetical protein